MAKIYGNLTELIGNTPLLELKSFAGKREAIGRVIAKLEYFNPLGSVKDRIGYAMIKDAEDKGIILALQTHPEITGNNDITMEMIEEVGVPA